MTYSVVLLNYSNSEETKKSLKVLIKYNGLDHIVVVDNGSPILKFQIIKNYIDSIDNPKIVLIRSDENLGYASGNNIGLRFLNDEIAYRDVVIVMNPDVRITENNIEQLVRSFNDFPRAVLAPKMKNGKSWWSFTNYNKTVFHEFMHLKYSEEENTSVTINTFVQKVDVLSGALLAAKMSIWEQVGYFDENTFLYGEEEIFQYKARQQGVNSYVLLNSFYDHVGGSSTGEGERSNLKKDFLAAKRTQDSRKYYFSKYLKVGRIRLFILSIVWFFYTSAAVIKRSINRHHAK